MLINGQPSSLRSIIAGSTAGAVEIGKDIITSACVNRELTPLAITYPAECTVPSHLLSFILSLAN